MKKLAIALAAVTLGLSALNAYNPPAGADSFYELSSTKSLSGVTSVAGGGVLGYGPDSIVINPALTADEQRIVLNAGYTALVSTDSVNEYKDFGKFGSAVQTGILIPFKMFNLSGYMNGTFLPCAEIYLKDSMTFKAGLSKQITPKLNFGVNGDFGFAWGAGSDWAIGAGTGFVYDWGKLAFLPDFRFGASLLNLGKYYVLDDLYGAKDSGKVTSYPSLITFKAGAAATFYQNENIKVDGSMDFTVPTFQNFIVDMAAKVTVKDMLVVSLSEKINAVEEAKYRKHNLVPALGVFFKFNFNVKNNAYLERNGWSESEMTVSAAYKNLYETVNAVSTGVDIHLGMKDETPPVITLWADDAE